MTSEAIAKTFFCSARTVDRIYNRFLETGSSATVYKGGAPRKKITAVESVLVIEPLIQENYKKNKKRMRKILSDALGKDLSRSDVDRVYKELKFTRKMIQRKAAERNPADVRRFLDQIQDIPVERMAWLDEVKVSVSDSCPRFGYSKEGERCTEETRVRDSNVCIHMIAGMRYNTLCENFLHAAIIDGPVFTGWFQGFAADLPPESIIIWDNAAFHLPEVCKRICEEYGHRLVPFPAKSPEFNPQEGIFKYIKFDLEEDDYYQQALMNREVSLASVVQDIYARIDGDPKRIYAQVCI
jgi:putative transposase